MATTTYGVGCKNIKIGAIAADGGISAAFADAGRPMKGTVEFTDQDSAISKYFAENARYPFLAVADAAGTTVKFTLNDLSYATLAKWLGGTSAAELYSAASSVFSMEQSWSADTIFGKTIKVCRLFMTCKLVWNMTRTEIAKLEVVGEVMEPEKAGEAPFTISPTPA